MNANVVKVSARREEYDGEGGGWFGGHKVSGPRFFINRDIWIEWMIVVQHLCNTFPNHISSQNMLADQIAV